MSNLKSLSCMAVLALLLAGCDIFDGSDGNGGQGQGAPQDFTAFVNDQFAATADDTDPVDVDNVNFQFNDNDDPNAFDNLLQ